MIFRVLQIRKMIKEGREDPGKFAGGQAGDLFVGLLLMPIISAVLLLSGLFILGYTTLLGGPYGFFKFFFLLSLFCVFFFFMILRKVYKMIKRATKSTVDDTLKVESKVIE